MIAALFAADGDVRALSEEEAGAYSGPGFVWVHIEGQDDLASQVHKGDAAIPDIAASALAATETRPRCDSVEHGAILNLRGLGLEGAEQADRLVSIRMWIQADRIVSVSRHTMAATAIVRGKMESGHICDSGDLVAAYAWAISTKLDPEVAALGDCLDEVESALDPQMLHGLRRRITGVRSEAIGYRRFVAPDRDALRTLAELRFDWLAEDDRLHIVEAADRFARMAEELEAVRERAALLHEQITDLRAEQIDQRALYIAVVAFIFLPLTFVTGLLGMNVEGIPYAHSPWSFWGTVIFCLAVGISVMIWFRWRNWLRR